MTRPRRMGTAWLAFWLLVAGTFGYRATTHEAASEAVASSSASTSLDRRLGRDPAYLKPIEQIEVGQRVALAINPTEALDDSLGTVIHPHVWRKIELRPDPHSHIVMLRPEWWVNERVLPDRQTMAISIPEVGIHGDAEIISISPCPPIPAGQGRVVIGTFSHLASETIRLSIEGIAQPIRCTPNHATWSVEAGDFVAAHDLQSGEHVLCRGGIREVVSVEHLPEPIEVFNLEIHGQQFYQITTGGMLVHNAGPAGSGAEQLSETSRRRAMDRAQEHAQVPRVSKGGQEIPVSDLNATSRGRNAAEVQRQGGTNVGRRDPETGAHTMDHPDGHPDMVGDGQPAHHSEPHVHGVDRNGNEVIITYPPVSGSM